MNKALVYIQLQNDLHPCFWDSLRKAREHWKGKIILVAPQREFSWPDIHKYDVIFVDESKLKCKLLEEYNKSSFFEKIHIGWNGFWDNACKRFIYLYMIMEQLEIEKILHIETDVAVYTDIFKQIESVYKNRLVFSSHASFQFSCCTMYCDNKKILEIYCNSIIDYFNRGTHWFTDKYPSQTILNETHFAYTFGMENNSLIDLFPTMPDGPHFNELGFLIDPTAWGMWVDGSHRNPGNQFATMNHYIGAKILSGAYDIHFDLQKKPFVYDKISRQSFPLATLHFNSKRIKQWI